MLLTERDRNKLLERIKVFETHYGIKSPPLFIQKVRDKVTKIGYPYLILIHYEENKRRYDFRIELCCWDEYSHLLKKNITHWEFENLSADKYTLEELGIKGN